MNERRKEVDKIAGRLAESSDPVLLVLRAHLMLEAILGVVLEGYVHNSDLMEIDRFTFAERLRIAGALGIVPTRYFAGLKALNRLRNKLAHELDASITEVDVQALVQEVKFNEDSALLRQFPEHQRLQARLTLAVAHLIGAMSMRRDIYVDLRSTLTDEQYALMQHVLGSTEKKRRRLTKSNN